MGGLFGAKSNLVKCLEVPSSSWASSGMLMWRSTRGFPPSAFCRPKSGIGPNCRVLQLDLAVDGADAPSAKPTCEQPGTAEAMNGGVRWL